MHERKTIRVLVADDSLVALGAICAFLGTLEGISIVGAAKNGYELLKRAEELRPDLVITDLCMPQMSGVESTLYLREFMPAARIIVYTELGTPLTRGACLDAGADGFLDKSQMPEDLVSEIHRLFPNIGLHT